MARDFPRSRRIAEQLQRELSDIIRTELRDPRIAGMITITDIDVSLDCSHANVYFTQLGDPDRARETGKALQHAAGFLRSELSHRLKLRTVPQLKFEYDASVERGVRLSRLIDEAVAGSSSAPKKH